VPGQGWALAGYGGVAMAARTAALDFFVIYFLFIVFFKNISMDVLIFKLFILEWVSKKFVSLRF
jgi:hypothetical protein